MTLADVAFLQQVANQVAVAVENAWNFEASQHARRDPDPERPAGASPRPDQPPGLEPGASGSASMHFGEYSARHAVRPHRGVLLPDSESRRFDSSRSISREAKDSSTRRTGCDGRGTLREGSSAHAPAMGGAHPRLVADRSAAERQGPGRGRQDHVRPASREPGSRPRRLGPRQTDGDGLQSQRPGIPGPDRQPGGHGGRERAGVWPDRSPQGQARPRRRSTWKRRSAPDMASRRSSAERRACAGS